jgi:Domain of unknown function (DUF4352)
VDTLYVMSTQRYRAGAALLMAPLMLAGCAMGEKPSVSTRPGADGAVVSPSSSPPLQTAKLGVPFQDSNFEVTVTKVETGVRQLDITDDAKSHGLKPWRSTNGQYVIVHLTARNVGNVPTFFSTSDSGLVDDAGKTYNSVILAPGTPLLGQSLGDDDVQPHASASGFIVFDMPNSAGTPTMLLLQPKKRGTWISQPATVNLRG